ncbi:MULTISPECIES: HTTM domain-containing protein [unclassified Flavobacterium]|uniref:HTTM domain-containing protein n=1 Tax=unclassified Flavobacterium TaxID=196869 RepID=UPI000A6496A9|nr:MULTISPECIES: HTTM domain-containing protein [unclassified Flavobacterium]MBN9284740.1 HTTM domain-containing protein [Flavobacterium sp.]
MLKESESANDTLLSIFISLKKYLENRFQKCRSALFTPIDNSQLILFRIVFGILISWHCIQCIMNEWVRRNFILPTYTFSHIGMEWLQPLPGEGMHYYFYFMALLGVFISIGLFYRWSLGLFTLLWAGAYFMQKTAYNNHHYLLLLVCIIMLFLPANASHSVDARRNPDIRSNTVPSWCIWVMILQIAIVYFFATVAKLYSGWLDGSFTKGMLHKNAIPLLENLYNQQWFYLFIAYAGILFDLLIVPALLWHKTRKYAFMASLFFHLFNKLHLGIGIFPFMALSFSIFFFPPETIRKLFFRNRTAVEKTPLKPDYGRKMVLYFFIPFFIFQVLCPLRHWVIKGDVLWTEEGHRLSWRMMLRNRSGYTKFLVVNNETGRQHYFKLKKLLTKKQIRGMQTKPDMIWQTAQKIKEHYQLKGKKVSIYIDSKVAINKKQLRRLIDPNVDFAKAEWNYFSHNEWILLYD